MSRFSWKRRAGGIAGANSYELWKGGVLYAIVQEIGRAKWFSYGMGPVPGWNTSGEPAPLEEAKADALSRVRNALDKERG